MRAVTHEWLQIFSLPCYERLHKLYVARFRKRHSLAQGGYRVMLGKWMGPAMEGLAAARTTAEPGTWDFELLNPVRLTSSDRNATKRAAELRPYHDHQRKLQAPITSHLGQERKAALPRHGNHHPHGRPWVQPGWRGPLGTHRAKHDLERQRCALV